MDLRNKEILYNIYVKETIQLIYNYLKVINNTEMIFPQNITLEL